MNNGILALVVVLFVFNLIMIVFSIRSYTIGRRVAFLEFQDMVNEFARLAVLGKSDELMMTVIRASDIPDADYSKLNEVKTGKFVKENSSESVISNVASSKLNELFEKRDRPDSVK